MPSLEANKLKNKSFYDSIFLLLPMEVKVIVYEAYSILCLAQDDLVWLRERSLR